MRDFVISEFRGLNTKKEDAENGILLTAKVAKNVDLRGGVIKPFKNDTTLDSGHSGEVIQYGPDIVSGKEGLVTFQMNGFDLLLYKDAGKWKRVVRKPQVLAKQAWNVESLSQPIPNAPKIQPLPNNPSKVVAEPSPEGWFYEMGYVITFVREIDGYRDESAPSAIISSQNEQLGFRILRPQESGSSVKYWNIYRISYAYRATTAFQKVAEVPISQDSFDDYQLGSSLSDVLEGIFENNGTQVLRHPAPVEFDGICSKLYYGQVVGWKDETLYISEPNFPESFPVQYQIPCSDKVVSVETINGSLYAFTQSGVQRIIGENPVNASILPDYIGHRVANRRATISTEYGLFYVFKTGVARINSNGHASISRAVLSDDYFKNIDMASVHLGYGDGILYVFHSKGTLLFIEDQGVGFVELSQSYEGSFYDRRDGSMVVTRSGWAWRLHQGTEDITFQYQLGGLVLNQPDDKRYESLRFYGEGKTAVTLYLDEVEGKTKTLDLGGMLRDRKINFPHGNLAREATWKVTGRGKITEIKAILNV